MSVTGTLAAFALKHSFDLSADTLVNWLGDRFTDHSQALPRALGRANDRAWQAVGLALAGDGLIDRVKDLFRDRDLTAAREAIRGFLGNTPTGLEMSAAGLRVRACDELNRLRRLGRLAAPRDRATIVGGFARFGNTGRLTAEAGEAVGAVADALAADAPHLAEVLRLAPPDGPPLLVTAFLFFLRREIETHDELAHGLTFDSLRQLTAAQDRGFALLDDRTEGILDQIGVLFDALGNWFTAADGKLDDVRAKLDKLLAERHVVTGATEPLKVSVTNEKELAQIRHWRDELRKLPPELLASADWTKLGDALAGGRLLAEAREAHEMAAANAKAAHDRAAEAEAEYKAYRVACEQEQWGDALPRLIRAAELDSGRFAPFPLNRYEPVRVLGAGGFGTVTLCRERLKKNREVAVKSLHPGDLGRSLEELFGEAHTVSELDGPTIIKVIHWDFADPAETRPYLVMEYFPGVSLAAHLKQHGPLPVPDFISVARNIAKGVTAAHGAGVLHRDLKPGNILVRRDGAGRWDVRVIDFGLAVRFSAVQASVSTSLPHRTRRDQSFAGTLEYASPEQKGVIAAPIGPRSDIYSFGKTMLEALLGTTEPVGDDWELVHDAYRDSLRRLLERCVIRDPARRHPGFETITEALTALDPADRAAQERVAVEQQKQAEAAERARVAGEMARKAAEDRERAEAERLHQAAEQREREETARRVEQERLRQDAEREKLAREASERQKEAMVAERARVAAEITRKAAEDRQRAEAERLRQAAEQREREEATRQVEQERLRLETDRKKQVRESAERKKQVEAAERARLAAETARQEAEEQQRAEADRSREEADRRRKELSDSERAERMELWKRSGMPRAWVRKHLAGWGPDDWSALVSELKSTPYWPLKAEEMGTYLEALRAELRAERDRRQREAERRQEVERKRQEAERQRQEEEAWQKAELARQGTKRKQVEETRQKDEGRIRVTCPTCRAELDLDARHAGREVECGSCLGVFLAERASGERQASRTRLETERKRQKQARQKDEGLIRVTCPSCRAELELAARHEGHEVECGSCLQIFLADRASAEQPQPRRLRNEDEDDRPRRRPRNTE